LIFPTFGTLELIIEKGWLVFLEKKNNKWTLKVGESNNNINIFDYNLLGLFDEKVFSTIYWFILQLKKQ
jgi:hypothetical protein